MNENYVKDAAIFRAFCDEHRLQILDQLKRQETCACNILEDLNIGQSTLSHHMKILVDSGIVNVRKDGKWKHYSLSKEGCDYALRKLEAIATVSEQNQIVCDCVDCGEEEIA